MGWLGAVKDRWESVRFSMYQRPARFLFFNAEPFGSGGCFLLLLHAVLCLS